MTGTLIDDDSFALAVKTSKILMVTNQRVITWQKRISNIFDYYTLQISFLNDKLYWYDIDPTDAHIGAVTKQGDHIFRS